jgi:hypothetical protein
MSRAIFILALVLPAWGLLSSLADVVSGDEFDKPPINYRSIEPAGRVSTLREKIATGEIQTAGKRGLDALRLVLNELDVSESSQMLVFSKTSLQRQKIAPRTPRAIYFSDDVYVGYCHNSNLLEVSEVDPQLGAVYYTIETSSEAPLEVMRQTDDCLICHGSSQTRQVPGHVVRSVYVDSSGLPVLAMGSKRIDHTSRFGDRWGGWYVTGTHGDQTHLGNLIIRGRIDPRDVDNSTGQNVTSLETFLNVKNYLTPHSDLVALMVLEHQAEGHNRITRAGFQCRMALHQQEQLNRELGKPADYLWDSTKSRIASASEELLQYLLFCDEAELKSSLKGTSGFAEEFGQRGPHDNQGRSLREFDLSRRLFKYPCSYLIYSEAFDSLPCQVKEHIWRRMAAVLTGVDRSDTFKHLSDEDRQAIREILIATKTDLPENWAAPDAADAVDAASTASGQ